MEPFFAFDRSELEKLENNMQLLRDEFAAREKSWDRAMEQERTFRQMIARLFAEIRNKNELLKRTNNKLRNLNEECLVRKTSNFIPKKKRFICFDAELFAMKIKFSRVPTFIQEKEIDFTRVGFNFIVSRINKH